MDLLKFLTDNNFEFNPIFDDTIHRFIGASRKSKSGWYIGRELGDKKFLIVGDWASGQDPVRWSSKRGAFKSDDYKRFYDEAIKKSLDSKITMQENAAVEAVRHIERNVIPIGVENFSYCKKKQISKICGAVFAEDKFGPHIAVPMTDVHGKLWNLQKIYDDGTKIFLEGSKKRGCFFSFGNMLDPNATFYVCEGFATGYSIFASITDCAVIVAFDSGNLSSVVSDVRSKYKNKIIVAADNDQFNPKENVGVKAALDCKIKFGVEFIAPNFPDGSKDLRPTDFNDLYCIAGPDEVRKQLAVIDPNASFSSEEYLHYKNFFELVFPTAKKCFLTGDVSYIRQGQRCAVLNEVKATRAKALMVGLPKQKVEDYLDQWVAEMPASMIVDIPEWDGVDYLSEVFKFVSVENIEHKYFVELMKEWFSCIFMRINDPFYQNKMVIFGGAQGIGKDTFIENLFKDFRPYFTSSGIYEQEKDNFSTMARSLVINISEFDRTSRLQVSQLKNIITAAEATFRAPYARVSSSVTFRTSFISSCNIDDIFRDETGNRRYMFFKLASIDWKYPKGLSLQLLAQAKQLAFEGYSASPLAIGAMKTIVEDMTPETWESYADEIWNEEFRTRVAFSPGISRHLPYHRIADIVEKIAKTQNVGIKMVQSYIKKKYQRKIDNKRLYFFRDEKTQSAIESTEVAVFGKTAVLD